MTLDKFINTIIKDNPPEGITQPLAALWHAKKENWETAHEIVQKIRTTTGSWIHAVLHRQEGDLTNAMYWYRIAGKNNTDKIVDEEFDEIIKSILE